MTIVPFMTFLHHADFCRSDLPYEDGIIGVRIANWAGWSVINYLICYLTHPVYYPNPPDFLYTTYAFLCMCDAANLRHHTLIAAVPCQPYFSYVHGALY